MSKAPKVVDPITTQEGKLEWIHGSYRGSLSVEAVRQQTAGERARIEIGYGAFNISLPLSRAEWLLKVLKPAIAYARAKR